MPLEFTMMARGGPSMTDVQAMLDQFEKETRIHVRLTILPWETAWIDIVKMALYGSGPDISEVGTTWLSNLVATGALRPFQPGEVGSLGGPAAFLPAIWATCTVVGNPEVWAIPWLADTRLIYYRRDWLEGAGIEEATAFQTHEDLKRTLARLQAGGVTAPWGVPTRFTHITLHAVASWIWGAGGDFISEDGTRVLFDQPEARTGIRAYYDLHQWLAPAARHQESGLADSLFTTGQAAATISGSWTFLLYRRTTPDQVASWGMAIPPGIPFVGGSNLAIWRHSRRPSDALKLIHFLTRRSVQIKYNPLIGLLPVRVDAMTDPAITDDPAIQIMVRAMQAGRSFPTMRRWGLVEDRLGVALTQLWADVLAAPKLDLDALMHQNLDLLAERLNITLRQE